MYSQHHRWLIHNQSQHPYKHSLSEFAYVNPALPGVTNAESALNWMLAVFYPQTKDAVNTKSDLLALTGNQINDYRVVLADESSAGEPTAYRWEQREGDVAEQWYKIYSMDWGEESILSNFLIKTQDVYAYKYGLDDRDETGALFAGDLAGQRIYGGNRAGSHLILYANSGDGTGTGTGFVQFGDDVRPLTDSEHTLGADTYRWVNFYTDEANVGNLNIVEGVGQSEITSTTGAINFGDENLSTDGTGSFGTLLLAGGSITDSSGTIDFDNEDLQTSGDITANMVTALGAPSAFASGTTVGDLTLANGSITTTNVSGAINFGDDNLITTGFVQVGLTDEAVLSGTSLNSDIAFTYSTTAGDLQFVPGSNISSFTGNIDASGTLTLGPADNAQYSGTGLATEGAYAFSSTTGGFSFAPNNLEVDFTANLDPTADATYDLGESGQRWKNIYLSGYLMNGAGPDDRILLATLLSFRDATVGAANGHALFWDNATSRWLSSAPDTEIDHGSLNPPSLLDDDHTQYALLAGRSGGQTLIGGTAASDDLTLDSTSDVTKGQVVFASVLAPGGDNTLDIGASGSRVRDLYMGGQGIGFRFENQGALPAAGSNGRAVWINSTTLYVDNGTDWQEIGSDKFVYDHVGFWNGTQTTFTYTNANSGILDQITDPRRAVWELLDNTNGFRRVDGAVITKTATTVTVTVTVPLATGTYRLVGVG